MIACAARRFLRRSHRTVPAELRFSGYDGHAIQCRVIVTGAERLDETAYINRRAAGVYHVVCLQVINTGTRPGGFSCSDWLSGPDGVSFSGPSLVDDAGRTLELDLLATTDIEIEYGNLTSNRQHLTPSITYADCHRT